VESQPESQVPQRLKTERLVLNPTNFPVTLETQGTVRAHHSTMLTPMVSGVITAISPSFEDGAFFEAGEVLLELDPSDLRANLITSEARLARAEVVLAQEEAKARQARQNWDDIGYSEAPSALVLREPQLKDARFAVAAAQSEVDQSRRNLDRAKVRAPFAGRVKSRSVGLGQAVGATTPLGEIFTTDFAEVRLPFSPSQLPYVKLPKNERDPAVPVILTDALVTGPNLPGAPASWQARIVRTEGMLDETTLGVFAIARIEDPFGQKSRKPELRIGQPVHAAVQGAVLKDVYAIPRLATRDQNRVFLIDPDVLTLQQATIKPIWATPEIFVVRDGLDPGAWLATSQLPCAPEGAPVDLIEPRIATGKRDCLQPAASTKS
jgi:RND family efflux transporter MFP subunit